MRVRIVGWGVGLLMVAPLCAAQAAFNGTWRPDAQVFSATRSTDVSELANGLYACKSCKPPYSIKADGQDQALAGNPSYDSLEVAIADDGSVTRIAKKSGKTVVESKTSVSADGKMKTEVQTLYFMAPRPVEMTMHSTRIGAPPPGAHAVSGEWRVTDADVSNHAEDTIFKVSGQRLEMSDRMGRSFAAKLDGTEAPYIGSAEFSSVSVKLLDERTIEESDKKDGKLVKITRWEVAPDGKTLHVRFDNTKGFVQEQTGHKVE